MCVHVRVHTRVLVQVHARVCVCVTERECVCACVCVEMSVFFASALGSYEMGHHK